MSKEVYFALSSNVRCLHHEHACAWVINALRVKMIVQLEAQQTSGTTPAVRHLRMKNP